MDSEESETRPRREYSANDPLPPDEWAGYRRTAQVEALYAAHAPQLARFFRRRAHAQDIGDLVQECFRRLVSSKGHAPLLIEQPAGYLVRTARNLLAEKARRDTRHRQSDHHMLEEGEIEGPDPHHALEARDAIRRVEEALARLKPRTREIFLMHRFDGLRYEEIAARKGLSIKGVEKQIAKALIAIRRARSGQR